MREFIHGMPMLVVTTCSPASACRSSNAAVVLDDCEDVQARPGQGADFEEVAGEQCLGLAA
jgi:hypothetical protein